jgi:hypothetical protein
MHALIATCRTILIMLVSAGLVAQPVLAASTCPLIAVADSNLLKVFRNHHVKTDQAARVFTFRSKLDRDDDGAPTAYHRGRPDGPGPDPGLDHICNGGNVIALVDGELVLKYLEGSHPGSLNEHSSECKADYIAIREAHFPLCSVAHPLCMSWFGVRTESFRSCGFNRPDMDCGIPYLQRDETGKKADYYLSTNILIDPAASDTTTVQGDYADATKIPFIVMPNGSVLPVPSGWAAGDFAAMVVNGRVAFGIVGDSGPAGKLGEASATMLDDLGIHRPATIDEADGAFTLIIPGSSDYRSRPWPLDPSALRVEAKRRIVAAIGGTEEQAIATLLACAASR